MKHVQLSKLHKIVELCKLICESFAVVLIMSVFDLLAQ